MIGALENISNNLEFFTEAEWKAIRRKVPRWRKIWSFKRCQINGVIYQSGRYNRVTARNNFTIYFSGEKESRYGSILSYVKVQDQCQLATCSITHCKCKLGCNYFALVQVMTMHQDQLPGLKGKAMIGHIHRVEETTKIITISLECILEKCMLVSVSRRHIVCHLANRIERD